MRLHLQNITKIGAKSAIVILLGCKRRLRQSVRFSRELASELDCDELQTSIDHGI
jgi:hypothetical protein